MSNTRKEEAMDLSASGPPSSMPALLPMAANEQNSGGPSQQQPQQRVEMMTPRTTAAAVAVQQDALSILAATATSAVSSRPPPAPAPQQGRSLVKTESPSASLLQRQASVVSVIPETVMGETADPSTATPRGTAAPVTHVVQPTSTPGTPSSGARPQITFPAGYMVIPTDQLKTIRMSAPEGAKFVQLSGVMPKINPGQMMRYPPESPHQSAPSTPTQIFTPRSPQVSVPATPESATPRPTLLYSPPGPGKSASLQQPLAKRVKREENSDMMLVDDEKSAGEALVELAQGGPITPINIQPQVSRMDGNDDAATRQKAGQALVDLSRSSSSSNLQVGQPQYIIDEKGQMYVKASSNIPKVVELSQVDLEGLGHGKDKEPLRKILKKNITMKTTMTGANFEQLTTSPPADIATELGQFINNYYNADTSKKAQKQIPMKELRHVIPLLVLHCFDMKDHALHKKVKGLWVKPPEGWPESVPFCDPNNSKQKGELVGKPKKDTLSRMYNFLIQKYWEKNGKTEVLSNTPLSEPVQESMVTTEHGYTRSPSPTPGVTTTPATDTTPTATTTTSSSLSLVPSTASLRPDNHGAMNLSMPKRVEEDNKSEEMPDEDLYSNCEEFDEDYDPLIETMRRLKGKINLVNDRKLVPDSHYGFMHIIFDLLDKMRGMIQDNLSKRFFLEKAHEFESTVDISLIERAIPKAHRDKWHDFEDSWQKEKLSLESFQQEIIERKLDLVSSASVVSKITPEQKSEDLVDLLGKLNIKPCAGQDLQQMLEFDCVEVRFMKTPAGDVEESITEDSPNEKMSISEKDDLFLEKFLREGAMEEGSPQEQPNFLDQLLTHGDTDLPTMAGHHTRNPDNGSTPPPDNSTLNSVLHSDNPIDTLIRTSVIIDSVKETIGDISETLTVSTTGQEEDSSLDMFDHAPHYQGVHQGAYPVPVSMHTTSVPVSMHTTSIPVSVQSAMAPHANVDMVTQQFEMQSLMSPHQPTVYPETTATVYPQTTAADNRIYVTSEGYLAQAHGSSDVVILHQENTSPPAQPLITQQAEQSVPETTETKHNLFSHTILRGLMSAPKKRSNPGGKGKTREPPAKKMMETAPVAPIETTASSVNHVVSFSPASQVPEVVIATEAQSPPVSAQLAQLFNSFPAMEQEPQIPTMVENFGSFWDDQEQDSEDDSAMNRPLKRKRCD